MSDDMKPETLYAASRDQFNLVLGFFSRVDSKLSVILAINTGMLAMLGTDAPPLKALSWPMVASVSSALTLLGASFVFLYRGAFPILKGGNASLVYFGEIASRTEHRFIEQLRHQTEDQHVNDVPGQIWRNSNILKDKFDALKLAFIFLALAIVPWLAALALFAAYAGADRAALLH